MECNIFARCCSKVRAKHFCAGGFQPIRQLTLSSVLHPFVFPSIDLWLNHFKTKQSNALKFYQQKRL